MLHKTIPLHQPDSLSKACAITYLLDHSEQSYLKKRPVIVICPGGGYEHLSPRESEPIALQFNAMGYHAILVNYSLAPITYPTQLYEVASVVKMIYEHGEEWHIDTSKIILTGFSAGGHLAGDFCMNWSKPFLSEALQTESSLLKPAGMILSYPVVSTGPNAHQGSFLNLLGNRYEELKSDVSLEHLVNKDTPPAFIWHTFTDQSVPVENSLLLVDALRKCNISTEFHIFPQGRHGLALANELTAWEDGSGILPECSVWLSLAQTWLQNLFQENF
ncbi:MAG: alpha/beta hydrolase [Lachnospiraceae bacterium]|nr:alpha/beta hydrolase [Lachnospiraceae bacterium]